MPSLPHHAFALLLLVASSATWANIRLPAVFSDHMVIQRELEVPIWGWAAPREVIKVSFANQSITTTAGEDGRWRVELEPMVASSNPRILTIEGETRVDIEDVLVGEVWICGGQSNMEWTVDASSDPAETRASADRPEIRLINAPRRTSNVAETDIDARWVVCSPKTVGSMTAVGYAFACDLQDALDVPIGLLSINWGGTRIEPWISSKSLLTCDLSRAAMDSQLDAIRRFEGLTDAERFDLQEAAKRRQRRAHAEYLDRQLTSDDGIQAKYIATRTDDSAWSTVDLPASWTSMNENLQDFDGGVWYRRTIQIPDDWSNRQLRLQLGSIDDSDIVWFDGVRIGSTVERHTLPRGYRIPAALVKPGPRTLTVLAIDSGGEGGFNGPATAMKIGPIDRMAANPPSMSLAGAWKWKRGGAHRGGRPPAATETMDPPGTRVTDYAALHNGMIAPFAPYAVRGAIWYQGESNADQATRYAEFLPLLIADWARTFERDDFPFGVVQLAAFKPFLPNEPAAGDWAFIRESQTDAALGSSEVGLVVTTDIGDADDIHPRNKREVGRRLGSWARGEAAGPRISSGVRRERKGGGFEWRLDIESPGGDLSTRDDAAPSGFAICGPDGTFRWAEARFDPSGRAILVSHPDIEDPVAVRYAWQSNPENANVVDARGWPLDGWRSDRDLDSE